LLLKKGFWPKGEQRKQLVWTSKAKSLMLMAVGLHLLIVVCLAYWLFIAALIVGVFLFFTYYLLLTTALLILWPLDFLLKQIVITRAKSKIKDLSIKLDPGSEAGMTRQGLKIIGIAGSYGKTTMKEVLRQVLGIRYKVLSTPESVNTPVGISRWILKNLDSSVQILIVEMGEHYKGDIKEICNIVKPDTSVVTGINESHLERMHTMGTIVQTVFEIVSGTKAGGMVVLNGDDERVMKHYKEFIWPDHRIAEYKVSSIMYKVFDSENLCWKIKLDENIETSVNLLGEYALGDVDAAVKIAKSLGMSNEEINAGIKNIKPVEHRLQPIKSAGNILVIDDAYNGNPDGVREAIKVLSRFEGRRKVFITPGLVEMGKASAEVHRQIGKELAGVADIVVLIKNSVTPEIELGIMNYELGKKPQVIWFESAQQAHSTLSTILKPNDVVVFQNDWGDQYI
jgi:UDP-N-acetylmuramoyl-tripeptide--D-alanyl-D-alanine ligase